MDRQTSKLKESFRYKFHTFLLNIYLLGFLHKDLWLTRNKILILCWNLYQKLHSVNEFEFLIYINPKSKTVTYILKYHRFTYYILLPPVFSKLRKKLYCCFDIKWFLLFLLAGVCSGLCNPSYWEAGIWGWLEDRSPTALCDMLN